MTKSHDLDCGHTHGQEGEACSQASPALDAPVPAATANPEDVRILVGWLLDIVLRKGVGQHELDAQLVVHAAKVFLGKDSGERS